MITTEPCPLCGNPLGFFTTMGNRVLTCDDCCRAWTLPDDEFHGFTWVDLDGLAANAATDPPSAGDRQNNLLP